MVESGSRHCSVFAIHSGGMSAGMGSLCYLPEFVSSGLVTTYGLVIVIYVVERSVSDCVCGVCVAISVVVSCAVAEDSIVFD